MVFILNTPRDIPLHAHLSICAKNRYRNLRPHAGEVYHQQATPALQVAKQQDVALIYRHRTCQDRTRKNSTPKYCTELRTMCVYSCYIQPIK